MKRKIITLLNGTAEDQLIAIEYLLENKYLITKIFGIPKLGGSGFEIRNKTNVIGKITLENCIFLLGTVTFRTYTRNHHIPAKYTEYE